MRAPILCAVSGRVARDILGLLAVLMLLAAAAKHLVEEATELRSDCVRQGKEYDGNEAHCVVLVR